MNDEPYYDFEDPTYCYPGTNVLRNKLGIRDAEALSSAETGITLLRIMDLARNPVVGRFDSEHLREIHRRLFSDIYDWAGEYRTVEISKGVPFCYCANIQNSLDRLFSELKVEQYLHTVSDRETMVRRLAYYLVELNVIHPFREGNGRVQRKFLEQLAKDAGFELNLDGVDPNEMISASKEGMIGNYRPMEAVIRKSLNYTMKDVYDDAFGNDTSGAKSWAGHARFIIGDQIEKQSVGVFNVPLIKIEEPGGFKVPDYIDPESGICIEVFSGSSKGNVVDIVSGIPMVNVRKNTAANHIIEALRHAKKKFNEDSESYLQSKFKLKKQMFRIAMCSMDCTDYFQLNFEFILARMEGIHLSDYGLNALVIYFIPAGAGEEIYGGDVFVFYEGDIDRSLFIQSTKFTRIG